MLKNTLVAIFAVTTLAFAFAAYSTGQKSTALEVLLDDKLKSLAALEAEKTQLTEKAAALQAKVDQFETEAEARAAAVAALNAATVSEADAKEFGDPCRAWIAREFGDKDSPALTLLTTTMSDSWTKNGMLVFEIATPSSLGSSSSMYLCVVDKEKGSMFKPSAFETSNWRRGN
jgi:hypothetical protein